MTNDDNPDTVSSGRTKLHTGQRGLWIPPELREFQTQVVFRTPQSTIQHFGSADLDAYYPMVTESDFGDFEEFDTLQNPSLAPNTVSIKHQGEEAKKFLVNTDPDARV